MRGNILKLCGLHRDNGLGNIISWHGKILRSLLNLLDHVKGLLRGCIDWCAIFGTNHITSSLENLPVEGS